MTATATPPTRPRHALPAQQHPVYTNNPRVLQRALVVSLDREHLEIYALFCLSEKTQERGDSRVQS